MNFQLVYPGQEKQPQTATNTAINTMPALVKDMGCNCTENAIKGYLRRESALQVLNIVFLVMGILVSVKLLRG